MSEFKELNRKIFVRNSNVIKRNISDEVFLIPVKGDIAEKQVVFSLDTLGEFIWERIDGCKKLTDICNDIRAEYTVNEKQLKKDVSNFLIDLMKQKLIIEVSS